MDKQNELRREGIKNAKVGDKIYVFHTGGWDGGYWGEVLEVERLTPTQLVLKNGTKISKKSCEEVGAGAWSRTTYYPALPEFRAERNQSIRERKIKNRFAELVETLTKERKSYTFEQLDALCKAIEGVLKIESETPAKEE